MMINSLCGSMGILNSDLTSLKSESSCTKILQPTSPNGSESENNNKKLPPPLPSSSDLEQNSLTPSSLSFPSLKYEALNGEMEIQSPDTNSLWDSIFSEQLDGDFMISSPVRSMPSSEASNFSYIHHSNAFGWYSPPRNGSPLAPFNNSQSRLGSKGMSPLQRVCSNSPNNQLMQVETISLPGLESFLDDTYEGDDEFLAPYTMAGGGGSSDQSSYDSLTTVPALLDCLTLPNSSRFCPERIAVQGGGEASHLSGQESSKIYQRGSIPSNAPLLEQLQQERQQEKQHQQRQHRQQQQQQQSHRLQQQAPPQTMNHSHLLVPPPVGPEEHDSGLQLVHLLLACAEAVAKEDFMSARKYLHHLNRVVSALVDSMQRVASCFTEALSARLAATLTTKPSSSVPKPPFNPFPQMLLKSSRFIR